MAKKALLVIDMLKDFVDPKGALYCGQASRDIIPFIQDKIDEFRRNGESVFYVTDSHDKEDPEFDLFPGHCVEGTEGATVVDELKPIGSDIMIPKKTYDGMHNSDLGQELIKRQIREAYLVGVCTSICVMETANSLVKEGYKVFVYKNGVADFDPKQHEFALERMKKIYGVKIV